MIFKSDPYCEKGILIVMDMGDFEVRIPLSGDDLEDLARTIADVTGRDIVEIQLWDGSPSMYLRVDREKTT